MTIRKIVIRLLCAGVTAGIKHTEPLRVRNQFGKGMHLHLLHHLVAMCFHGALGRSQLMGDLLVDLATDDQIETCRSRGVRVATSPRKELSSFR
jgi:hypothetical protein